MPDWTSISNLLDSAPMGIHVGVAVAMLCGIVIWAFGRKLFRPLLTLTGLVVGAGLGLLIGGMIPYEVVIWWPVGIGALIGAGVSLAAYRFVTAFLLAVALALALPLGHFTYAEVTGKYADAPAETVSDEELLSIPGLSDETLNQKIRETVDEQVERLDEMAHEILDPTPLEGEETEGSSDEEAAPSFWREHLNKTLKVVIQTAAANWNDAPAPLKVMSVLLAAGGFFGGFLAGMVLPKVATAVVCSLVGSLIFLTCGTWLTAWSSIPVGGLRPDTPTKILIWWLGFSVIGLAIQFSLRTRPADKEETEA